MPNKLLIKANFCDLRNVKEETLAAYDVIEVRANVVVLNDRAKELIARYPVTLNVTWQRTTRILPCAV